MASDTTLAVMASLTDGLLIRTMPLYHSQPLLTIKGVEVFYGPKGTG